MITNINKFKQINETLSQDRAREAKLANLIKLGRDMIENYKQMEEFKALKQEKNAEVQDLLEKLNTTSIIADGVLIEVIKPYTQNRLSSKAYFSFVEESVEIITDDFRNISNTIKEASTKITPPKSYIRKGANTRNLETGIMKQEGLGDFLSKVGNWIKLFVSKLKGILNNTNNNLQIISNNAKNFLSVTESVESNSFNIEILNDKDQDLIEDIQIWTPLDAKDLKFTNWEDGLNWLINQWKSNEDLYNFYRTNLASNDELYIGQYGYMGADIQDHMKNINQNANTSLFNEKSLDDYSIEEAFDILNESEYVSTKDQLRAIARELKSTYRNIKFSIRVTYNTIDITILQAPIELRKDPTKDRESVNHYYVNSHYNDMPEAKEILSGICDIVLQNQREITNDGDYGSIPNYYVSLRVGDYDRPFRVTGNSQQTTPQPETTSTETETTNQNANTSLFNENLSDEQRLARNKYSREYKQKQRNIASVLIKAKEAIELAKQEEYFKQLAETHEKMVINLLKEFSSKSIAIDNKLLSLVESEEKETFDMSTYEEKITNAEEVGNSVSLMAQALMSIHKNVVNISGSVRQYKDDTESEDGTMGARFDYDNKTVVLPENKTNESFKSIIKNIWNKVKVFFNSFKNASRNIDMALDNI